MKACQHVPVNQQNTLKIKPHVLVLTSIFPAVSETFVLDHIVGLKNKGWGVTVVALTVDGQKEALLAKIRNLSVDVRQLSPPAFSGWVSRGFFALLQLVRCGGARYFFSSWVRNLVLFSDSLGKIVEDVSPDVIHAHFGPNGVIASFAARANHLPLLVDFHGYDVTVVPKREGWGPYRLFLRDAKAIVHSSFVESLIKEHLSCPVCRVHLGVDTSVFSAPERAGKWPEKVEFLLVGRLVFQKGFHIAIAMLAIFKRHFPDCLPHLTICGEGPQKQFLEQCALQYGVEESVTFTGALPHEMVSEQMKKADILLIPSVSVVSGSEEAFCRVAIEGMAMGLSVIGSKTGGLQETIGSGGSTCRSGSALALYKAVEDFLVHSNPQEAAQHACERAREFTIERMNEEYTNITY